MPIPAQIPAQIPARNNWSFNAAALEIAQLQTAAEVGNVATKIEKLIQSQPDAGILMDRLKNLSESAHHQANATAAGFKALHEEMGETTRAINLVAGDLTRMANFAQTIARHYDEGHNASLCTALYLATVNRDGGYEDTWLGELLKNNAKAIEKYDQKQFVEFVLGAKNVPKYLTADLLGCFYDLLKGVPAQQKRHNLNPGGPTKKTS